MLKHTTNETPITVDSTTFNLNTTYNIKPTIEPSNRKELRITKLPTYCNFLNIIHRKRAAKNV
jgi:sporulation-control protein spo0M